MIKVLKPKQRDRQEKQILRERTNTSHHIYPFIQWMKDRKSKTKPSETFSSKTSSVQNIIAQNSQINKFTTTQTFCPTNNTNKALTGQLLLFLCRPEIICRKTFIILYSKTHKTHESTQHRTNTLNQCVSLTIFTCICLSNNIWPLNMAVRTSKGTSHNKQIYWRLQETGRQLRGYRWPVRPPEAARKWRSPSLDSCHLCPLSRLPSSLSRPCRTPPSVSSSPP